MKCDQRTIDASLLHPQRDLAGREGGLGAVGVADDERAVVADGDGRTGARFAAGRVGDLFAERERAGAVIGHIGFVGYIFTKREQFGRDAGGQFTAADAARCVDRARDIRKRRVGGGFVDVEPEADDDAVRVAAFKLGDGFGQDAADLFAANINIVDPLDHGMLVRKRVDGARGRNGGH